MVPESFRRQLRQEAEHWWSEGLIDIALYERLSERYQFNRLERDASNRFVTILLSLGAVLLGLGAITFVAANWQLWSRSLKVLLLLSCFIGVNVGGFYLWRRPTSYKGQQRLGQGLLLLGALLLGANMALMSQMFHQTGQLYELFLVWGLGVAAMAYSLRLTSLGVLALILVQLAYGAGWVGWSLEQAFSIPQLVVQHLPIVIGLVFVPLAYWCRSRAIFGLSAIAITTSLTFNLKPLSLWSGSPGATGWLIAIAFVLPPALLWSYSGQLWQRTSNALEQTHPFQSIARSLAIWFLSGLFYFLSFHWLWQSSSYPDGNFLDGWNWQPLIDAGVLAIVAGLGWLRLGRQIRRYRFQAHAINSGLVALFLVLTAGMVIWHQALAGTGVGVFGFNVMLFLLALALIRDGLALGSRRTFWGGMVLLVLGILSRLLEYNTGLLLKSIVFALCGAGVIAAGLWFERNVKPRRSPSFPQPPQEESL